MVSKMQYGNQSVTEFLSIMLLKPINGQSTSVLGMSSGIINSFVDLQFSPDYMAAFFGSHYYSLYSIAYFVAAFYE